MSYNGPSNTHVSPSHPLSSNPAPANSAPFLAAYSQAADRPLSAALDDITFGGVNPPPPPLLLPKEKPPTPGLSDLSAPLPTIASLSALQRVLPPQPDATYLPWIRDVLFLIERLNSRNNNIQGLSNTSDPYVRSLASAAASALLHILSGPEPHPPEAFYLRGLFHLNGATLELIPRNPRNAFRDFETAATRGWAKAWFKLGRDYEMVNDTTRARDCFERGLKTDSEICIYRLGMAKLLGQLGFPPSADDALPLLHRAAMLANMENPHPAYVWALLLSGELLQAKVEERSLYRFLPPASSLLTESRHFLERAAYYGFAAAQFKLGQAYEYAVPPYLFDPLRSMQYYSLASQQGEAEADMALSKWFLCGWEGAFEKDETLAVSFAEKAARNGLVSAEFAMGYYTEVGIGGSKDLVASRHWYTKAVQHGNPEAGPRLSALSQPAPQVLSRSEHDQITDARLVRRRTQAYKDAAVSGRLASIRADQSAHVVSQVQAQARTSLPQTVALSHHPAPHAAQAQPPEQPLLGPNGLPSGAYLPPNGHTSIPTHQRYGSLPAPTAPLYVHPYPPTHRHPTSPPSLLNSNTPRGRYSPTSGPPRLQSQPQQRLPSPNPNQHAGARSQPLLQTSQVQSHQRQPSGPATFAEMGFQVGKARDKDCIVM